jgi:glycosyltransferase involved in cell wall biosynthesis
MKKVVVSVTNDLVTDQRVLRSIEVLQELGCEVHFVGRCLPASMPTNFPFASTRFRLWFNKGFLFYANYNLRLFWFLLWHPFDVYLANDLDTLLPNTLVAKGRKKPLIYDSHEYFTGVPEIQNRPLVKGVWSFLERWLLPKADAHITVNQSIAQLFANAYKVRFNVVRNIGKFSAPTKELSRQELGLPQDAYLLINQGAGINVDRGMEEVLEALPLLPENIQLLIVGNGDAVPGLKASVVKMQLEGRVHFVPKQPYHRLLQYTLNADCGLSLDKDTNLNYRYSLPNKLFDYINCGLPLLVSNLTEVANLVNHYHLGEVVHSHDPEVLAKAILRLQAKGKAPFTNTLQQATSENNWQAEKKVLQEVFRRFA